MTQDNDSQKRDYTLAPLAKKVEIEGKQQVDKGKISIIAGVVLFLIGVLSNPFFKILLVTTGVALLIFGIITYIDGIIKLRSVR